MMLSNTDTFKLKIIMYMEHREKRMKPNTSHVF